MNFVLVIFICCCVSHVNRYYEMYLLASWFQKYLKHFLPSARPTHFQAIDSIHQVGVYCLALVPSNTLPKTPLGGIHLSETKQLFLEGALHPCNVLMCPHTCVTNLPKPRQKQPGVHMLVHGVGWTFNLNEDKCGFINETIRFNPHDVHDEFHFLSVNKYH